jgi:peptidoglycan/LPS O-acetylase OafA/YrhL
MLAIMENPAVVYIGKISYSLYLFHWPLIVFCRYVLYGYVPPLCANGIAIALSFGVSILS